MAPNDSTTAARELISATIAWHLPGFRGAEWCHVERDPGSTRIEGVTLIPEDGSPTRIEYAVELDAADRTRTVHVEAQTVAGPVTIDLAADGAGTWRRGDETVLALAGAVDIDLGFSPITNSLPIWRLSLVVGEEREIDVLWIKFPGFELIHAQQTYSRLGPNRYHYASGTFAADLLVSDDGLVEDYAEWQLVGRTNNPPAGTART